MKKFILIMLSIVLTACSFGAKSEIARNQEKWKMAGITHYRYSLFVGCFCAFTQKMPLHIEVKDGEAVSMAFADGTLISPNDPDYELFVRYGTIDRLFTELEADLNGEADEVTVTYDSTYGFPQQINIDRIKLAMDDELSLTVSEFEVLP